MYCIKCGHEINENENYCPNCGYKVNRQPNTQNVPNNPIQNSQNTINKIPGKVYRSKSSVALLAFFLGNIGVHSFYIGKIKTGIGHIGLVCTLLILNIIQTSLLGANLLSDTGVLV